MLKSTSDLILPLLERTMSLKTSTIYEKTNMEYDYISVENYKKYPLYKSHSEYGFIEPLKSFQPSSPHALVKI